MRRLIVTADDFGRDVAINEAVEAASCDGILSGASLMVAAPAAADAVARAHRLPGLRVGLHLVLSDGRSVLPPGEVRGLLGADGRFDDNQIRAGLRYFFVPGARRRDPRAIRGVPGDRPRARPCQRSPAHASASDRRAADRRDRPVIWPLCGPPPGRAGRRAAPSLSGRAPPGAGLPPGRRRAAPAVALRRAG